MLSLATWLTTESWHCSYMGFSCAPDKVLGSGWWWVLTYPTFKIYKNLSFSQFPDTCTSLVQASIIFDYITAVAFNRPQYVFFCLPLMPQASSQNVPLKLYIKSHHSSGQDLPIDINLIQNKSQRPLKAYKVHYDLVPSYLSDLFPPITFPLHSLDSSFTGVLEVSLAAQASFNCRNVVFILPHQLQSLSGVPMTHALTSLTSLSFLKC